MIEAYTNMIIFGDYQYIITDKNILIKKNIKTGEETRCKMTNRKWYTAKEIEEHLNASTERDCFKASPIWDSVLKGKK